MSLLLSKNYGSSVTKFKASVANFVLFLLSLWIAGGSLCNMFISEGGGKTAMLPSLRPNVFSLVFLVRCRCLSLPLCRLAAQPSQSLARPSPRLRPPPPLDLQPNLSTSSSRSSASLSRPVLLCRPRRSVAPRPAPPVVVL